LGVCGAKQPQELPVATQTRKMRDVERAWDILHLHRTSEILSATLPTMFTLTLIRFTTNFLKVAEI
jgi:hypothetical protein